MSFGTPNQNPAQPAENQIPGYVPGARPQDDPNVGSLNHQQPQQTNSGGLFSWADDLIDIPLSIQGTSEAAAKLIAAMDEIKKNNDTSGLNIKLLVIDNQVETMWRYSAAVVCVETTRKFVGQVEQKDLPKSVAFYPMLLEATENKPLEERVVRVGNSPQGVVVKPVPSNGLDAVYLQRIEEEVRKSFPGYAILYVPGLVVGREVDFESGDQLKRVIGHAVRSCVYQTAEITPGFVDINLSRFKSESIALNLNVRGPNQADPINAVNRPVRQDFTMDLMAEFKAQNQHQESQLAQAHQINGSAAAATRLGRLSAYLDTRLLPPVGFQYGNTDPFALTRRFVSEVVITSVDSAKMSTVASMFLMIAQATIMGSRYIREGVMYQLMRSGQIEFKGAPFNPTDIGFLDLVSDWKRTGQPAPWDLETATSTPKDFIDYVNAVFLPTVAISIDVPRLGPQSAYMNILSQCARGDATALAFLMSSLDKLSNGRFSQVWQQKKGRNTLTVEDVFSECNNTIYTGHFPQKVGDTNRMVDLRHIDTTAVIARFGKQDRTMIDKWAQSFIVQGTDPAVRMELKRDVINAYTNDSAVITDMADRHSFNTEFLTTIVQCNVENHFNPVLRFNNPLAGANTGLVNPRFMQGGLFADAIAGSFGQTTGQQTGGYGGGMYYNPTAQRF